MTKNVQILKIVAINDINFFSVVIGKWSYKRGWDIMVHNICYWYSFGLRKSEGSYNLRLDEWRLWVEIRQNIHLGVTYFIEFGDRTSGRQDEKSNDNEWEMVDEVGSLSFRILFTKEWRFWWGCETQD